jgi:hypothetical protein
MKHYNITNEDMGTIYLVTIFMFIVVYLMLVVHPFIEECDCLAGCKALFMEGTYYPELYSGVGRCECHDDYFVKEFMV